MATLATVIKIFLIVFLPCFFIVFLPGLVVVKSLNTVKMPASKPWVLLLCILMLILHLVGVRLLLSFVFEAKDYSFRYQFVAGYSICLLALLEYHLCINVLRLYQRTKKLLTKNQNNPKKPYSTF